MLALAGASLLWERLWPRLWPFVAIAGLFLALALDRRERIPRWKVKPNTLLLATFAFFTLVWVL